LCFFFASFFPAQTQWCKQIGEFLAIKNFAFYDSAYKKIALENETLWLNQKQIVELFDKNQSVISRHIGNIFKDDEVDKKSNMQKMHIANSDKPKNSALYNSAYKFTEGFLR
jgi:hypothetical protein